MVDTQADYPSDESRDACVGADAEPPDDVQPLQEESPTSSGTSGELSPPGTTNTANPLTSVATLSKRRQGLPTSHHKNGRKWGSDDGEGDGHLRGREVRSRRETRSCSGGCYYPGGSALGSAPVASTRDVSDGSEDCSAILRTSSPRHGRGWTRDDVC